MKKIILTMIIISIVCGLTYGQKETENSHDSRSYHSGISIGVYLSNFEKGKEWSFPHYHTLQATFEDKNKTGFYFGYFWDINIAKRLSLQPEIYYNHIKHAIVYDEWSRNDNFGTIKDANFTVSYSRIKLSFLQNLSFGKNIKFNFLAGPYFEVPFLINNKGQITTTVFDELTRIQISSLTITDKKINKSINCGLGGMIGFRLDIPHKKNYICAEIKMGKSFNDLIELPNIKESFKTISLIYLLNKSK